MGKQSTTRKIIKSYLFKNTYLLHAYIYTYARACKQLPKMYSISRIKRIYL